MQETEGKAQQLFVCRLDFLLFRFRELDCLFLRMRPRSGHNDC